MGFKGSSEGVIPSSRGTITNYTSMSKDNALHFLSRKLKVSLPTALPAASPLAYFLDNKADTNLEIEALKKMFSTLNMQASAKTGGRLGGVSEPTYVNAEKGLYSQTPFLDNSLKTCAVCKKVTKACDATAVLRSTSDASWCTTDCMTQAILTQQCPRLGQLLAENCLATLDQKVGGNKFASLDQKIIEHKILGHVAALCYLRYIMLSPSMHRPGGQFYQVLHAKIVDFLVQIGKIAESDQSWSQALAITKQIGIDTTQLSVFTTAYQRAKQDYNKQLLTKAIKRSYESLDESAAPVFDEKDMLRGLQRHQFEKVLSPLFNISEQTPHLSYARFYYEIISLISKQTSVTLDDLEILFKKEALLEALTKTSEDAQTSEAASPTIKIKKKRYKRPAEGSGFFVEEAVAEAHETAKIQEVPALRPPQSQAEAVITTPLKPAPGIPSDARPNDARIDDPCITEEITDVFAGSVPYTITLFKANHLVPLAKQTGLAAWNTCTRIVDSYRIRAIGALADLLCAAHATVKKIKKSRCYTLMCDDENYDSTVREKLDLHHLFSPEVERYLRVFGIAEMVKERVLVSIPGKIAYQDGSFEVGFFQETFIPGSWTCTHRCFKRYTNNQDNTFITPLLRTALITFVNMLPNKDDYQKLFAK